MKRLIPPAVALLSAGMLLIGSQDARSEPPLVVPGGTNTEISLGGEIIMRMRENAGGFTAEQRAEIVRDRLVPILSLTDLKASDVTVRSGPGDIWAAIYVREKILVTVSQSLAQANQTKPTPLAEIYAEKLRRILPQVNIKKREPTDTVPSQP